MHAGSSRTARGCNQRRFAKLKIMLGGGEGLACHESHLTYHVIFSRSNNTGYSKTSNKGLIGDNINSAVVSFVERLP